MVHWVSICECQLYALRADLKTQQAGQADLIVNMECNRNEVGDLIQVMCGKDLVLSFILFLIEVLRA